MLNTFRQYTIKIIKNTTELSWSRTGAPSRKETIKIDRWIIPIFIFTPISLWKCAKKCIRQQTPYTLYFPAIFYYCYAICSCDNNTVCCFCGLSNGIEESSNRIFNFSAKICILGRIKVKKFFISDIVAHLLKNSYKAVKFHFPLC